MKQPSITGILSLAIVLVLCPGLVTPLIACTTEAETSNQLGVVVTIPPLADFVENVGGEKVAVTVMVPPGASPHTYEPTPSQMAALSKAKMYAKVGSGVEFELTWLDKLIAINGEMLVVDGSKGVELQEMVAADEHEHEGEKGEPRHGAMDPHIWMSPRNARIMVANIGAGLGQVDPENREYYAQNLNAYLQKLDRLDANIRSGLASVTNRAFMTYHPAFGYFARDYNLTMLPIEEAGKEPTPARLARLIEQAKERNIKVILASPQFNPESAKVIADAIDGRVAYINPMARDYITNLQTMLGELAPAMK